MELRRRVACGSSVDAGPSREGVGVPARAGDRWPVVSRRSLGGSKGSRGSNALGGASRAPRVWSEIPASVKTGKPWPVSGTGPAMAAVVGWALLSAALALVDLCSESDGRFESRIRKC